MLMVNDLDKLRFEKLWSLKSSSVAAVVVLDRKSNGRVEWKARGSKRIYSDWQKAQTALGEE